MLYKTSLMNVNKNYNIFLYFFFFQIFMEIMKYNNFFLKSNNKTFIPRCGCIKCIVAVMSLCMCEFNLIR